MKKAIQKLFYYFLIISICLLPMTGCEGMNYTEDFTSSTQNSLHISQSTDDSIEESPYLNENGSYTTKEDVTNYLIEYNTLPDNFITKKEARESGWSGGSLEPYAPGKCIGGDYFGNYEGTLPEVSGRTYYECDIDTLGATSRGAKRIVYSDDGQIYYTEDHYETFTLLYGDDSE